MEYSNKSVKTSSLLQQESFVLGLVDKHEEHLGSFSPQKKVQVVDLGLEQAPSGFFVRGTYEGKAMVKIFATRFKHLILLIALVF